MDKLLGVGVDSALRFNAQRMRDAGAICAGRYLSKGWKGIRRDEYDELKRAGLHVFFMWEFDGRMHGRDASRNAAWDAQDELRRNGLPLDAPVYFNFADFDIAEAQLPALGECFDGVRDRFPIERIGAYGSHSAMRYLFDTSRIRFGHQVLNGWSGGGFDDRCSLLQTRWNVRMGGQNVDVNNVYGLRSMV